MSEFKTKMRIVETINWHSQLKIMKDRYDIANLSSHQGHKICFHYNDVIMGMMASQITSLTSFYSTVYSGADQRKHQSCASLAFVLGIHRWPVNSQHKGPVTRKMFPSDDVIMCFCITMEKFMVISTATQGVVVLRSPLKRRQTCWMTNTRDIIPLLLLWCSLHFLLIISLYNVKNMHLFNVELHTMQLHQPRLWFITGGYLVKL